MVITICGSEVERDGLDSNTVTWTYEGKEYVFCESDCLREFLDAKDKTMWLEAHK
ncbi:MAG: hypothetical protein ACFFFG_06230 [Candidatus Thorarchaeota archaeon]